MKASIQLEYPADDRHRPFTTLDYVRGTVKLSMERRDAVSKISVTLSGNLLASLVAAATNPLLGTYQAVDNHKLFELSQDVFPPPDIPPSSKGFSLQKGTKTFPFHFRFPVLAACPATSNWIRHYSTTLPPSVKVQAHNFVASGEAKYLLRAKIERTGRFKSDLTVQQELMFMPLDPSLPPPMIRPVCTRTTEPLHRNHVATGTPSASPPAQQVDNLSVTFEVALPSPAVLYMKSPLPLRVFAGVKETSPGTAPSPVLLRSLCVALRTETLVAVGLKSTSWSSTHELIKHSSLETDISGSDPPGLEIDKDLWKDVVVPDIIPSFTTCTLAQHHFLVVTGGFSQGTTEPTQMIKTSINVDVHSGIRPITAATDDEEEQQDHNHDQRPFIPWRLGSERHLGIIRQSSSASIHTPPPAYF